MVWIIPSCGFHFPSDESFALYLIVKNNTWRQNDSLQFCKGVRQHPKQSLPLKITFHYCSDTLHFLSGTVLKDHNLYR